MVAEFEILAALSLSFLICRKEVIITLSNEI